MGQSLNLYMAEPSGKKLSDTYQLAWRTGLKTTYYLRSRPKTRITKTTVEATGDVPTATDAVSCSLENPETCEACQ